MNENEEIFKRYLSFYWLRPDNALSQTLRSISMKDIKFEHPSVDISCGDGLFMFYHLGGETESNFDGFTSTQADDFKHEKFIDIYNNEDKYYTVPVEKKAETQIDYGTDWKQALLDKASRLGIYKKTVLFDCNNVPFPFRDNYFKTIYDNSLHWIKNAEPVVKDMYRMLKPDGSVLLHVITPYQFQTLDELEPLLSKEAIDILNRQRRETMSGRRTLDEWSEMFTDCGFEIKMVKNIIPNKLAIDIWNTGPRPFIHLLVQMVEQLEPSERNRIKEEWIDICYKLFKPFLTMEDSYPIKKAPHLLFKLTKE